MKNLNKNKLASFKIPIPPMPIQKEIVNILDTFSRLEARKKQYKYYLNKLLSFEDIAGGGGRVQAA